MKSLATTALRAFNTFGVEAQAAGVVEIESPQDLELVEFNPDTDLILGGGSNVLLAGDLPGTAYLNRMRGRQVLEQDTDHALVEAAAGENWHELVLWTLDQGLSGLENLALIPGLAGAAPMQNIGAYGVELAAVVESVNAWDLEDRVPRTFGNRDCGFAYRDSRFRSGEPGRHLITSIRLRLDRHYTPRLTYTGLREELESAGIGQPTARQACDAVIRIRRRKLPDPAVIGNAGSFFKNPEVGIRQSEAMRSRHPGLPIHRVSADTVKLSAAWMIEQCGWKGFRDGDAGVSDRHALVLVNHGQASGGDLLDLARRVASSVADTFGVELEPEPVIIGA